MTFVPVIFYCFPVQNDELFLFQHAQGSTIPAQTIQPENNGTAQQEQQKWNIYLQIFRKQLLKNFTKCEKKKWETEQDQILIQLRQKGMNWVQISKYISKSNPQICKRRYTRLIQNEKKWPKVVDDLIKLSFEQQAKDWEQIQQLIQNLKLPQFQNYSIKKLKERYFLHLKAGIQQRDWQIQEDLHLLNLLKQKGKKWKELTANFQGRTELQLKNRYNGTLKLIEKRVFRKLNAFIKSKSNKQKLAKN